MAAHERASAMLAVSTVIFALRSDELTAGQPQVWLPLVRRIRDPYEGRWALPGGPLRIGEDLAFAAARTLGDTTGLTPRYLEQLYTPARAPRTAAAGCGRARRCAAGRPSARSRTGRLRASRRSTRGGRDRCPRSR